MDRCDFASFGRYLRTVIQDIPGIKAQPNPGAIVKPTVFGPSLATQRAHSTSQWGLMPAPT